MNNNEIKSQAFKIIDAIIPLVLKGISNNEAATHAFKNWKVNNTCSQSDTNKIKDCIFKKFSKTEKLYYKNRLTPQKRRTLEYQCDKLVSGLIRSGISDKSAIEMSIDKIKEDRGLWPKEIMYCLIFIRGIKIKKNSKTPEKHKNNSPSKLIQCPECKTKLMSNQELINHIETEHKKHDTNDLSNHTRMFLQNDTYSPQEQRFNDDSIDLQNSIPSNFNIEAYKKALLKMTQHEAWKLAKNKTESNIFLANYTEKLFSIEDTSTSNSLTEEESIVDHEDVKSTSRTIEINTTGRHSGDQADFKTRVKDNFNGRCAVTGFELPDGVAEAAHIEENVIAGNMNTSNGLYLEVNLHRMFDRGLLGIDPYDLTVHFAIDCLHKIHFDGCTLQPHRIKLDQEKLIKKWGEYIKKTEK